MLSLHCIFSSGEPLQCIGRDILSLSHAMHTWLPAEWSSSAEYGDKKVQAKGMRVPPSAG